MTGRSTDAEQRVGLGIDFHRFVAGRPLVLGGVIIPFEKGLLGHSDADVLLHAISDALLGAASLGDIGQHFPDSDSRFKDADSARLLLSVVDMLEAHGWAIGNVDAVVVAEEPKLAGYVSSIRSRIAQILKIPVDRVGIKATTSETMGALGRREGMAAQCVVLIRRSPR
ncbi:2-C-methyl-D-erythritol 2,4-cyclodiphosphate synthase [Candidatus Bipolaricaulota bacterium]|nr:2-C-methyl-D-erythritol 2,4-cyclodiphosphate synthase [Candidatus Bipolaricaulota bacterium]